MKWISVKDRLPEKQKEIDWRSVHVIVTDGKKRGIGTYSYESKYWTYIFTDNYEQDGNNITHWMPLPKPPQDEN